MSLSVGPPSSKQSSAVECYLSPGCSFTPSPGNVLHVRAILCEFFPEEIADTIIDFAEYWPLISASRSTYASLASALVAPDSHAQWCYLISPKIPCIRLRNGARVSTTIKQVKFLVKNSGCGMTELGNVSFDSWFEASILNPCDPEARSFRDGIFPQEWHERLAVPRPDYLNVFSEHSAPNPFDRKKRWHVTNNGLNSTQWREIVWSSRDAHVESMSESQTGNGHGFGFLHSLSVDDRIVLLLRAKTPGFLTTVFNVKVEVYSSLGASSYI